MWSSQRGLAGKLIINGEFRPETTRCSKCDHLLHNGSVRLDFMTDDGIDVWFSTIYREGRKYFSRA